jgi:hypothetical protein
VKSVDYEQDWPKHAPQFCDKQIKSLQKKLENSDLAKNRREDIEIRLSIFKRIRDDYLNS